MNIRYLMAAWRVLVTLLLAAIAWQMTVANRYLKILAYREEPNLSGVEEALDQIHGDIEELQALLDK